MRNTFLKIFMLAMLAMYMISCTPDKVVDDDNKVILKTWTNTGETVYFTGNDSSFFQEIYTELLVNGQLVKDSTKVQFYCNKGRIDKEAFTINGVAVAKYYPYNYQGEPVFGKILLESSFSKKETTIDTLNLNFVKNYGDDNIFVTSLYPKPVDSLKITTEQKIHFVVKAHTFEDEILKYYWYLDGLQVATSNPTFTFPQTYDEIPGIYKINLKIVSPNSLSLSYNWNVIVVKSN